MQIQRRKAGKLVGAIVRAAILLPALSAGAFSQVASGPSDQRGHSLTQRLCVSCHLAPDGQSGTAIVGIPSLQAIANRQGQTGPNIESVLIKPHPPMPDIRLTNDEIADIIAYLETLRSGGGAPLVPRPPAPTPETPKNS